MKKIQVPFHAAVVPLQLTRYRDDKKGTVIMQTDKTLDIKGLSSPRPIIVTDLTLTDMQAGQVLRVITNDRSTKKSLPDLCRERGYELLHVQEEAGTLCFIIRK